MRDSEDSEYSALTGPKDGNASKGEFTTNGGYMAEAPDTAIAVLQGNALRTGRLRYIKKTVYKRVHGQWIPHLVVQSVADRLINGNWMDDRVNAYDRFPITVIRDSLVVTPFSGKSVFTMTAGTYCTICGATVESSPDSSQIAAVPDNPDPFASVCDSCLKKVNRLYTKCPFVMRVGSESERGNEYRERTGGGFASQTGCGLGACTCGIENLRNDCGREYALVLGMTGMHAPAEDDRFDILLDSGDSNEPVFDFLLGVFPRETMLPAMLKCGIQYYAVIAPRFCSTKRLSVPDVLLLADELFPAMMNRLTPLRRVARFSGYMDGSSLEIGSTAVPTEGTGCGRNGKKKDSITDSIPMHDQKTISRLLKPSLDLYRAEPQNGLRGILVDLYGDLVRRISELKQTALTNRRKGGSDGISVRLTDALVRNLSVTAFGSLKSHYIVPKKLDPEYSRSRFLPTDGGFDKSRAEGGHMEFNGTFAGCIGPFYFFESSIRYDQNAKSEQIRYICMTDGDLTGRCFL